MFFANITHTKILAQTSFSLVAWNKMTWPYLAVTTKNEFDTPVVICESIVTG